MKSIKRYFVLWFLLNITSILYAQDKTKSYTKNKIKISGKITGEYLLVKKININIIHGNSENPEFKSVKPNLTGGFEFTFEDNSKLSKITQMVIYYDNGHDILNNYVVEPNDSVFLEITISKDSVLTDVNFSGRGFTKYKCRREIEIKHNNWDNSRVTIPLTPNTEYYDVSNMDRMIKFYTDGQNSMLNTLNDYRNKLNYNCYELIRADVIARVQLLIQLTMRNFYTRDDKINSEKEMIRKYYNRLNQYGPISDQVVTLSPEYPEYLLSKFSIESIINSGNDVQFQNLKTKIETNYEGLLKDKLLMLSITHPFHNSSFLALESSEKDEYLSKVLEVVQTPQMKEQITSTARTMIGNQAYNFELPDTIGNIIKLQDLKGKVILLDMWFTGCTGCALIAKRVREKIYPEFKLNNFFTVISVCADVSKEMWLKSLIDEKYASKKYINVYTDGKGFKDDPMVQYYNLKGCPFVILIDKQGKIIHVQFTDGPSENIIIAKIKSALTQNPEQTHLK